MSAFSDYIDALNEKLRIEDAQNATESQTKVKRKREQQKPKNAEIKIEQQPLRRSKRKRDTQLSAFGDYTDAKNTAKSEAGVRSERGLQKQKSVEIKIEQRPLRRSKRKRERQQVNTTNVSRFRMPKIRVESVTFDLDEIMRKMAMQLDEISTVVVKKENAKDTGNTLQKPPSKQKRRARNRRKRRRSSLAILPNGATNANDPSIPIGDDEVMSQRRYIERMRIKKEQRKLLIPSECCNAPLEPLTNNGTTKWTDALFCKCIATGCELIYPTHKCLKK